MPKEKNFARGPRIRSGGQTGVDRAALDAAVLTGRPYEGWCPKGGWAEDFLHPPGLLTKYPHLIESPSESPERRTDWNVRDSAATVVFVPDSKYWAYKRLENSERRYAVDRLRLPLHRHAVVVRRITNLIIPFLAYNGAYNGEIPATKQMPRNGSPCRA